MYKLLSAELIEVSPIQAMEYRELNKFESQRKIWPRHVQFLTNEMKSGGFRTGEFGLAVLPTSERFLVNGQHQIESIIQSRTTIRALLEKWACDEMQDIAKLYRKYDTNRVKGIGDMTRVEADVRGITWPYSISCLPVTGLRQLLPAGQKQTISKEMLVEQIKHNMEEGAFLNEMIIGVAGRFIRNGAVAAAMITTSRKDINDAHEFWVKVRDGEGLTKEMPEYRLRGFLIDNAGRRQYGFNMATPQIALHKCILAWNAFRKNKSTNLRVKRGSKTPDVI